MRSALQLLAIGLSTQTALAQVINGQAHYYGTVICLAHIGCGRGPDDPGTKSIDARYDEGLRL